MKEKNQESENFIYNRLLFSMSAAEKECFTDTQLMILKKAGRKLAPRKHRINIKMSIPIPYWPDIYCVFLAGEEQRSLTRIRKEKKMFWRAFLIVAGMLTLLASILFSTPNLVHNFKSLLGQNSAPTGIPWVDNEAECIKFDRIWVDGRCWDKQHDRTF